MAVRFGVSLGQENAVLMFREIILSERYCHVHPLVVVHAPASCGRGLEGDGRSILQVTRRRR